LYALLRWHAATKTTPAPAIGRRLAELAMHAEPDGRGVRWPWSLDPTDDALRQTYAPGWCNGTAGMVPMWTLAARLLHDPRFDELADRCAWHTWEHAGEGTGGSADLCCGHAGAAYALLARYQATGDAAWLRRATSLAERAVRHVRSDVMGRDSLYRGSAGVALLVAELDWPAHACMPFFGHEQWAPLAGSEMSGGY
jgi:serine/threonine-protein kinase